MGTLTLTVEITDRAGTPQPDVTVAAVTDGAPDSLVTDSTGSAVLESLSDGQTVTLTPAIGSTGTFDPPQSSVTMADADATASFVTVPFSIAGQVVTDPKSNGGNPNVAGATVSVAGDFADGSSSKSAETDALGAFSIDGVINDRTYSYMVTLKGWSAASGQVSVGYPTTGNPTPLYVAIGKNHPDGSTDDTYQWATGFAVGAGFTILGLGLGVISLVVAIRNGMVGAATQSAAVQAAAGIPLASFPGGGGGAAGDLGSLAGAEPGSPEAVQLASMADAGGAELAGQSGAAGAEEVLAVAPADFKVADALSLLNELPIAARPGLVAEDLLANPDYAANLQSVASSLGDLVAPPAQVGFDSSAFLAEGADLGALAAGAGEAGTGYAFEASGESLAEALAGDVAGFEMSDSFEATAVIALDVILCV